jgi:hypothetical protein
MKIDFLYDDSFNFWVPMELVKADPKDSKDNKNEQRRLIQGIASTDHTDLQNESVIQNGVDHSYFLKYGYYNNDHKPGFDNKVGQPLECKTTKEGLWTKGFLFNKHKIADSIWELALALEASKADRKLGFSIQGKVTRREGRRIARCWIQDIAITAAPINTNTWLDVLKSLNSVPADMWAPVDSFEISPRLISPVTKSGCGMCASSRKAFSIDEEDMDLKKDHRCHCKKCEKQRGNEEEEKALSTASARPIIPQSLEGGVKDQGWANVRNKNVDKSLTFDECVELLCTYRNLPRSDAHVVTEAVFQLAEK